MTGGAGAEECVGHWGVLPGAGSATTPAGAWQAVVVAKEPRAGRVKTRLCPPLTADQAAAVAGAALADTLDAVVASTAARRVLALDGAPGPWLAPGFDIVAQRGGGLAERLAAAVADAWAGCPLPVLLVGMDTPQIDGPLLDAAAHRLVAGDCGAVLGRAEDGGYWAIGLHRPAAGLFDQVPMSRGDTADHQLRRITALGIRCAPLPLLRDVDQFADALAVADQAPATRFAAVVRHLAPGFVGAGQRRT